MKGLELAKAYYENFGKSMLEADFADLLPLIAVGLCGSGSECYGYDDEISEDHDFEPGFCIFLPGEDVVDRKAAFQLERAYAKLPKEFMGHKRQSVSPVGGSRHGVIRINEFLKDKTGREDGKLDIDQWLLIPEYALSEVTNGGIFFDGSGKITKIREYLSDMPEDARKKRLAGALIVMAQSGQYNYMRCIKHGETAAAQLAVFEFTKAALNAVFLLNKRYMPYYKWSFKALRELPLLSSLSETLEFLLTTENNADLAETKYYIIEDIASTVISALQDQGLTEAICGDLEKHAYSVNDGIKDQYVRNLNIFHTV
ncbi:MAG: DUF4037 domain-containing protein [Clostridia bacterium]|nr:DUF4037 domain-containing protein [Clostridia bacterium]